MVLLKCAFVATLVFCFSATAYSKVIQDGPQYLKDTASLGDVLRDSGPTPVHILFVHGIAAKGAGASLDFQRKLCAFLKCTSDMKKDAPVSRDYADTGEFEMSANAPAFQYMGKRVWNTEDEWSASAPFVDHYVIQRSDGAPIVLDELNWWPLVFPLKCRKMVTEEARLSGPDGDLIKLCSQESQPDTSHTGRFKQYQWVSPEEAHELEARRKRGAYVNRQTLKNEVLDWGFSDAILALGSMRPIFIDAIRQLFVKSAQFRANGAKTNEWEQQLRSPQENDREFVFVSHSLGSYLVFSTLSIGQYQQCEANALQNGSQTPELDAVCYIFERTSLLYFFANQVPLLELADTGLPQKSADVQASDLAQQKQGADLSERIGEWKSLHENFRMRHRGAGALAPPQILAFSDPNDLLSWRLPGVPDVVVANLYVRNTRWRWLFVWPPSAHGNYGKNKSVLKTMLRTKK